MVSTRTVNRNRKIELLKESCHIILEMLLLEKRQLETINMAQYKEIETKLKSMLDQAKLMSKEENTTL